MRLATFERLEPKRVNNGLFVAFLLTSFDGKTLFLFLFDSIFMGFHQHAIQRKMSNKILRKKINFKDGSTSFSLADSKL